MSLRGERGCVREGTRVRRKSKHQECQASGREDLEVADRRQGRGRLLGLEVSVTFQGGGPTSLSADKRVSK